MSKLFANIRDWFCRVCRGRRFVLSVWIAFGCITGAVFALNISNSFLLLMRSELFCGMSIFWLILASFLPFLISAFAVYFMKCWIFYPIGFSRGFWLCFLAVAVIRIFGSAGWIVNCLFLFSGILTLPLLCWFWIRRFSLSREMIRRDFLICLIAVIIICYLDNSVFFPLLAAVLDT